MLGILILFGVLAVVGWTAAFGVKALWKRFWPESWAAAEAKALAEIEAEKTAESQHRKS